ncbi:MAG: helix-turn-helix domain-containing protein [Nanoarchaeota archaeon]
MPTTRITIIRTRHPVKTSLNDDLQWLCQSLGLFSERDKDKSLFRIFVELLKSTRHKLPLTSDTLALRTGLSRGTVVHHINKLISSGLVIHEKGYYLIRVENLEALIDEIEGDISLTLEHMRAIAKKIDEALGL